MIQPEQLADALERLDPRERELLALSLRRRVPDEALARVYDVDPQEVQKLARKHDDEHAALHDVMDCLAEMIWNAQRLGAAFDNASYLDCLRRKLE